MPNENKGDTPLEPEDDRSIDERMYEMMSKPIMLMPSEYKPTQREYFVGLVLAAIANNDKDYDTIAKSAVEIADAVIINLKSK